MDEKPKILITGGLGFIFSYVTEYFVAKGYQVVVIDNLSEGSHPEIINDSFTFHQQDVADEAVVETILQENPDYVIHAAAHSDVDASIRIPYEFMKKNILANLNVFEACRRLPHLKKFVYVSTDEVYGECETQKGEDDIIFPRNPYACSKATGSLMRLAFDNTFASLKDKTAETRFCNVFGPRQDARKILPAIKQSIETGTSIGIHQEGKGYREYLYVKNIPSALELILEKGNRTYNITLNDGYTVVDLIAKARALTGKDIITHQADRPGMDRKYQMSNQRILELGWKPLFTFDEGMKEYLCAK